MSNARTAVVAVTAALLLSAAPLQAQDRDRPHAGSHAGEHSPPSTVAPPPGQAPAGAPVQPGDSGFPSPGDEGSGDRPNAVAPGTGPGEPGIGER